MQKNTATCRTSACWHGSVTPIEAARLGGLALVLALLLALLRAGAAGADGLILDARSAGGAGPQLDAAVPSPQRVMRAPASVGVTDGTYVVRSGDTLGGIAARLGVTASALAAANGITDPDRIAAGQVLRVRSSPAASPELPDDSPLARVQLWPWPPAQGQTLAVWLQAGQAAPLSVRFADRAYPVISSAGGRGWALIPISPLLPPGTRPLTLTVGSESLVLRIPVEAGAFSAVNISAAVAEPILAQAARVRAETDRLAQIFRPFRSGGWTARDRFQAPFEGVPVRTSPFGTRRTYGDSPTVSAHEGEDFSAAEGAPVYAPAEGRVVLADMLFVRGNAVILDHGHGVYTGYWHLSRIDVTPGEVVAAGQRVGAVGNTGLSTGAHLHWELRVNGAAVDPMQWVEK